MAARGPQPARGAVGSPRTRGPAPGCPSPGAVGSPRKRGSAPGCPSPGA